MTGDRSREGREEPPRQDAPGLPAGDEIYILEGLAEEAMETASEAQTLADASGSASARGGPARASGTSGPEEILLAPWASASPEAGASGAETELPWETEEAEGPFKDQGGAGWAGGGMTPAELGLQEEEEQNEAVLFRSDEVEEFTLVGADPSEADPQAVPQPWSPLRMEPSPGEPAEEDLPWDQEDTAAAMPGMEEPGLATHPFAGQAGEVEEAQEDGEDPIYGPLPGAEEAEEACEEAWDEERELRLEEDEEDEEAWHCLPEEEAVGAGGPGEGEDGIRRGRFRGGLLLAGLAAAGLGGLSLLLPLWPLGDRGEPSPGALGSGPRVARTEVVRPPLDFHLPPPAAFPEAPPEPTGIPALPEPPRVVHHEPPPGPAPDPTQTESPFPAAPPETGPVATLPDPRQTPSPTTVAPATPPPGASPTPGAPRPRTLPPGGLLDGLHPGVQALAQLRNGNFFVGHVKTADPSFVTLHQTGGEVTLPTRELRQVIPLSSADLDLIQRGAGPGTVRLRNANQLVGQILLDQQHSVVLELEGARVVIPRAAIDQVSTKPETAIEIQHGQDDSWLRRGVLQRVTPDPVRAGLEGLLREERERPGVWIPVKDPEEPGTPPAR